MSYKANEEFLAKLISTPRATGYEFSAQRVLKEYLKNDVDKIYGDRVGNLFSVINPKSEFKEQIKDMKRAGEVKVILK